MSLLKKTLALALALLMVFTLAACSSGASPSAGLPGNVPSPADTDTPEPPPASDAKDGSGYEKGVLTETGFHSKYIGIRFTLPEGYIMATQEDMDAMIQLGADIVFEDADQKMIDYAMSNTVYEMAVSSPLGIPNIQVMVEKLALSNMTAEQYLNVLQAQLVAIDEIVYAVIGTSEIMIAGQAYSAISFSVELMGIGMIQDYYCRKIDNRMVSMIVSYTEDVADEVQMLIDTFTAY